MNWSLYDLLLLILNFVCSIYTLNETCKRDWIADLVASDEVKEAKHRSSAVSYLFTRNDQNCFVRLYGRTYFKVNSMCKCYWTCDPFDDCAPCRIEFYALERGKTMMKMKLYTEVKWNDLVLWFFLLCPPAFSARSSHISLYALTKVR